MPEQIEKGGGGSLNFKRMRRRQHASWHPYFPGALWQHAALAQHARYASSARVFGFVQRRQSYSGWMKQSCGQR